MTIPQIRLKTEGFRAIKSADIILTGITVVAGENGSGKSTLSKLLYHMYKSASHYEILVSRELRNQMKNIDRFLEIVISDIHSISTRRNTREEFSELRDLRRELRLDSYEVNEEQMAKWIALIEKIENNYKSQPSLFGEQDNASTVRKNDRLKFIIKDIIQEQEINSDNGVPFRKISALLLKIFSEAIEKIKSRPTSLFLQELETIYSERQLPEKFEVFEFDEKIVSLDKKSLSIPYVVQECICIDTPMMFGLDYPSEEWGDLNELLIKQGKTKHSNISNKIGDDIIGGDVSLNENAFASDDFLFRRKDGQVYNLIDCATGIKSFAILQLLINNGSLTDKTLVIIDEPESNLHPQWIIEYARIIVLLHKEVGVKFFLASHNPDMVSAIKYISEKEGVQENVNFYIADKFESTLTYEYRHLGNEIEAIFASFNIAIDRMNQYSI